MASASDTGRLGPLTPIVGGALALLRDRSESGRGRLFAAGAFAARLTNAGLGFITQIVLARWMGEREYGIYSAVCVWLLLAGGILSVGLPVAVLKFVPDYRERGDLAGLRGFLRESRRLGLAPSLGAMLAGGVIAWFFADDLGLYGMVAVIGLAVLPFYVLTDVQTGIARAFDFADLGLAADYLVRPLLLLVLAAAFQLSGQSGLATLMMGLTVVAVAATALGQGAILERRLRRDVPAGPERLDLSRWAMVSWPLLTVTGFTLLLGVVDILVLQLFVPPEEIAIYFAATKIVAVASFVAYGVGNTSAHRFATQIARGDAAGMAQLAGETVRWTFWPTLAVALTLGLAAGPLLSLFGQSFAAGAPIVWLLGAGLVAGAAVGPADRALAMAEQGRATAWIYAAAVVVNAVLCLALVPAFGLAGAAVATALAMAFKAALLFVAARRCLGITMCILPLSTARIP